MKNLSLAAMTFLLISNAHALQKITCVESGQSVTIVFDEKNPRNLKKSYIDYKDPRFKNRFKSQFTATNNAVGLINPDETYRGYKTLIFRAEKQNKWGGIDTFEQAGPYPMGFQVSLNSQYVGYKGAIKDVWGIALDIEYWIGTYFVSKNKGGVAAINCVSEISK